MNKRQAENYGRVQARLSELGFTCSEIEQLFRIERTLQRWGELECGTGNDRVTFSVERDEETDKPFLRRQYMGFGGQWVDDRTPYPDKEAGAKRWLEKIMAGKDSLVAYHQGDPRGCALYIVPKSELNGCDIQSVYNRGIAVCY